jgi:hypothetical protein
MAMSSCTFAAEHYWHTAFCRHPTQLGPHRIGVARAKN